MTPLRALAPEAGAGPRLDPQRIVETVATLRERIHERFPASGLERLAGELHGISQTTVSRLEWTDRPHVALRSAVVLVIVLIVGTVASVTFRLNFQARVDDLATLLQVIESGLNDILLLGAAILFLVTAEGRVKRNRALRFIHELRALAHIVDMHQLTKDPDRLLHGGGDTPSSPRRSMTRFELARYLDYCSEMLALISKVAALYAQHFDDPVVLQAVDGVQGLTTALSGNIWQKIGLLDEGA